MLHNIVKNMAEAKVSEAQFRLDFSSAGLAITTENAMTDKNTAGPAVGQGLLSIAALAKEAGGNFQYEIHAHLWRNHIFIPYHKALPIKKIAA